MEPMYRSGSASGGPLHFLTTKYSKRSKSVGILWCAFTICAAILNLLAFLQEEWVGDTPSSKSPGHFGLWRFCTVLSDDQSGTGDGVSSSYTYLRKSVECVGSSPINFSSILSPAFRTATVFAALSVLISFCGVLFLFLFFICKKTNKVFEICGVLQLLSGLCMSIGILCFPAGWDNDHVRGICGPRADDYHLGNCSLRWGFLLAVINIMDAWVLACLAFTLAYRPTASEKNSEIGNHKGGEINGGFMGDSESGKSLPEVPVMLMPHPPRLHPQVFIPPREPPFPVDLSHMMAQHPIPFTAPPEPTTSINNFQL